MKSTTLSETIPVIPKKFLTNQGENTLSRRLEKILPLTQDFDCLVGYFFISGFFRLYPSLESIQNTHPDRPEERAGRSWPDPIAHGGREDADTPSAAEIKKFLPA